MCRTIENGATTYRTVEARNAAATKSEFLPPNRFATAAIVASTKSPVATSRNTRRAWEMRSACQTVAIWVKSRIVAAQRSDSDAARNYVNTNISTTTTQLLFELNA